MSDTIRELVSKRREDIQGIILVALVSRLGGDTVITEDELEAASKEKGIYMSILEKGLRIEALPVDEVRKRAKVSAEAGGNNKPKEGEHESKKPKTK